MGMSKPLSRIGITSLGNYEYLRGRTGSIKLKEDSRRFARPLCLLFWHYILFSPLPTNSNQTKAAKSLLIHCRLNGCGRRPLSQPATCSKTRRSSSRSRFRNLLVSATLRPTPRALGRLLSLLQG